MVELQHRLIKQAINIAVSKAMEDMRSNTRRSIRNLIDLGLLFSQSENQQWFFNTAKKVISNPRNPYNALVARMIADVDNDTIKKVGVNLGYNSLIYGTNKLRKRQAAMDCPFPWLLIFDFSDSYSDFYLYIKNLILEGQELGIYSYIFCPNNVNDIAIFCEIAKQFEECLFIFKTSSVLISDQTVKSLSKIHNAVISIQITDAEDLNRESFINAFLILKQNRCFYGFHVSYNEENIKKMTTPEYIRFAINLGNLFGVYIASKDISDACKDSVYSFICKERSEEGQPLIALEWFCDIQLISKKVLTAGSYMAIRSTFKSY